MRFLAVLELFKQGLVDLDQPTHLRRHRGRVARPWTWSALEALAAVDVYDG